MNQSPFSTAAQEWLENIEKKVRLNKQAKRAVRSFAIWMDGLIGKQEQINEERKNGKEN